MNDEAKVKELIADMDVPLLRRTDWAWLNRNLRVRNSNHPNFLEANDLIKKLISS